MQNRPIKSKYLKNGSNVFGWVIEGFKYNHFDIFCTKCISDSSLAPSPLHSAKFDMHYKQAKVNQLYLELPEILLNNSTYFGSKSTASLRMALSYCEVET